MGKYIEHVGLLAVLCCLYLTQSTFSITGRFLSTQFLEAPRMFLEISVSAKPCERCPRMPVYDTNIAIEVLPFTWVIIDDSVYDLSKFLALHPGGRSVLLDVAVAGKDATKAFYSLHRSEVLRRPQYERLKIGEVEGVKRRHYVPKQESLSGVPYAEPTWLTPGYHSPYYKNSHRRFQTAVRKFVDTTVFPDAQAREKDGKMPSRHIFNEMARLNIIAMRLGPGKHLSGRVLMDGVINPDEDFLRYSIMGELRYGKRLPPKFWMAEN
ncbi:hypothetical protein DXG03_000486 [Asterophora parasitica]|uniref:Cytochrome b5 heme-binding domain-containing protein n=1 Tax=Asterophora parasitica TaxID=117018 RepID=A0A9P7KG16_9AGAR|nr:hypothetical protein DXG03_000486 [Asterophora parasitica]